MMNFSNLSDVPIQNITNDMKLTYSIQITVYTVILSLTTALANLGTIIAFWKVKGLGEKPSDYLILSLAVVDLFQGLILIPLHMSSFIFSRWIFGELGCKFYVAMAYASVTNGLVILCAISLDRLLLVKVQYPRYVKFQSKKRILCTIAVCWIISIVAATIDIGFWDFAKSIHVIAANINFTYTCLSPTRWIPEISLVFLLLFLLFPVFLVAALSVAFLLSLHTRLRKIRRVGPEDESTVPSAASGPMASDKRIQRSKNRYIKPAMTLGALVIAMIIGVVPYITYVVIIGTVWPQYLNPRVVYFLVLLLYCTPLFDAIMYAFTESKLRNFYVSCFRQLKKRR